MLQKKIALQLVEEALKELDSKQCSVQVAIQKLQRASGIVGDENKRLWCSIQLGDPTYTKPLRDFISFLECEASEKEDQEELSNDYMIQFEAYQEQLKSLGLDLAIHLSPTEITIKRNEAGGGYLNIGVIEDMYSHFVKSKKGNDGKYYRITLSKHIGYVKTKANEYASELYSQIKFSGTVSNCFELLKDAVDDKLLDLNPEISEQLMLAFRSVSSNDKEEWSQALTTCRRLIEALADQLYPPRETSKGKRLLGQNQYINRIWAFMDGSIESASNKELAKSHVDFLGNWLSKTLTLSHKGVHASLSRLEATKAVFHTYLVIADILECIDGSQRAKGKPDINTATIDELEVLLSVKRDIAKQIFKYRITSGRLDCSSLEKIRGIGPKTVQKAKDEFIID